MTYTLFKPSAALVLVLVVGAGARADYIVTDLGAGYAYGLNASGQVVGQNGAGHAFLYGGGTSTDLGTLGGPYSLGLGINDSGQVVGWAYAADNTTHGFLYSGGTMVNLSPSGVTGGAQGINNAGQVVGWYSNSGANAAGVLLGPTQPFLYSNGTETSLGNFPADSDTFPLSINDSGQVVGYTYQIGLTGEQPFLISNGATSIFGLSGAFQMINASGEAVGGHYLSDTVWRALFYSNGTFTDLGTLGGSRSWAYGINSAGQAVGDAYTSSGADHAYLYRNGAMTDLNGLIDPNSGWVLQTASAMNNSGQIVGWGTSPSGQTDAFLLTPVPEPASVTLLGLGALGALGYARRRRKVIPAGGGRRDCLQRAWGQPPAGIDSFTGPPRRASRQE